MKKAAIENRIIFLFFALCMGALAGAAVWAFFFIMGLGIQLIWTDLPSLLKLPFYPLIVCTLGGLIIGLWKSRFGDYPQDLSQVMAIVKKEGGYPYHNLHILAVSALIPLLFGASLGPEAGLTGFIAGICTFIGDKFKYAAREMRELTQVGMAATLGVIFNAPFFGIANQMEEGENPDVPEQGQNSGKKQDYKVSKRSKMVVYLASVAGGFLTLQLLTHFLGGGMGIPRFSAASEVGALELICLIPLALTGVLWGYFYAGTGKLVRFLAAPLGKHPVLLSVLGGICLGALGMFLPLTLFSGEHEMGQVMESWENLGFWTPVSYTHLLPERGARRGQVHLHEANW